jgi:hypothetical protein
MSGIAEHGNEPSGYINIINIFTSSSGRILCMDLVNHDNCPCPYQHAGMLLSHPTLLWIFSGE